MGVFSPKPATGGDYSRFAPQGQQPPGMSKLFGSTNFPPISRGRKIKLSLPQTND